MTALHFDALTSSTGSAGVDLVLSRHSNFSDKETSPFYDIPPAGVKMFIWIYGPKTKGKDAEKNRKKVHRCRSQLSFASRNN
jgi:hypothetical protein